MKKNKKIKEEDTIKHRLICLYGIFIKWIFSIFLIKIEIYIIIKINKRQIKIIDIIEIQNIKEYVDILYKNLLEHMPGFLHYENKKR